MRWTNLLLLCGVIASVLAEPDPKKYQSDAKDKEVNNFNDNLTQEEKQFLKDVETKFGIKHDVTTESPKNDDKEKSIELKSFPAVIAIEIVNDTESKGKRTVDANLGYGYKTNAGYTYKYFGKPAQEQGKFMIYPYSQEDIPPAKPGQYQQNYYEPSNTLSPLSQQQYAGSTQPTATEVEIQPSQAYQLVPVQEQATYSYKQPQPENVVAQHVPSALHTAYPITNRFPSPQSTLFTTYNGGQISGLTGNFPSAVSNYLVDSSQLLQHPQFQNAGLTPEHLRAHSPQLSQRVIPVLILRIPSSQLTNPATELYPNLPQNYPLSQHLNSIDLQKLVQEYYSKNGLGIDQGSQIPTYSGQLGPSSAPVVNYVPQRYAVPQGNPSYTHSDHSGVQYSAVQPVMATYPISANSYPSHSSGYSYALSHPQYQPIAQPQYSYQYQNIQPTQTYHLRVLPQYQQQISGQTDAHSTVQQYSPGHEVSTGYVEPTQEVPAQYDTVSAPVPIYSPAKPTQPVNEAIKETQGFQYTHTGYNSINEALASKDAHEQYVTSEETPQRDTAVTYPTHATSDDAQQQYEIKYVYQSPTQSTLQSTHDLSENYPSPHHTQATTLPLGYKNNYQSVTQKVNYVTPSPSYIAKHPYRVMVPQITLRNQEKVSYVNSQSVPSTRQGVKWSFQSGNNGQKYTVNNAYLPPGRKQQSITYPINYHSFPSRGAVSTQKVNPTVGSSYSYNNNYRS